MQRRDFLASTAGALWAMSIPGWAETFHQSPTDVPVVGRVPHANVPPPGISRLRRAITSARDSGRPLLVIFEADQPTGRRGVLWGTYFDSLTPDDLADLALVDIVCVSCGEVRAEWKELAVPDWIEGLALLVESDEKLPTLVRGPAFLPKDVRGAVEQKAELDAFMSEMRSRISAAVAPDRAALTRHLARSKSVLTTTQAELLGDLDRPVAPRADHARLVPAWLRLRALDEPKMADTCRELLAKEARSRHLSAAPTGSLWLRPGGCGATLEDYQDRPSGPCGTGFSPSYSARFLGFYSEAELARITAHPLRGGNPPSGK